ncbi:MAG: RuvX/YqgF family protein [bacterium]|nr:RuvX/YqgF family protein [bacterium]
MRILGIDFGSKRIGIAISDESRKFALPVKVLANNDSSLDSIIEIAQQNGTTEMVMGESRNYKQEPNPIFEAANEFKKQLEARGFTVYFELEFMTSVNAERFQGKNEHSDASAAALILQSYLDRAKV